MRAPIMAKLRQTLGAYACMQGLSGPRWEHLRQLLREPES